ncbi:MAG TPA: DUF4276 family protein [Longimicrobium sp.]|nr:DUF4276 family protein [Longimicrobium sp.]
MSDIRIYIEGGGDKDSKARMREAFSKFLAVPRDVARQRRVSWTLILCGSRDDTFKAFQQGVKNYPDAHVFLLVDAEQPVTGSPLDHLTAREPWDLSNATDEQCQLMAQVMESWFLADPQVLKEFYGSQFGTKQIPVRENVEEVHKKAVFTALRASTSKTQKGEYHKTQHAPLILEKLDPERVRARAPHCARLFASLAEALR